MQIVCAPAQIKPHKQTEALYLFFPVSCQNCELENVRLYVSPNSNGALLDAASELSEHLIIRNRLAIFKTITLDISAKVLCKCCTLNDQSKGEPDLTCHVFCLITSPHVTSTCLLHLLSCRASELVHRRLPVTGDGHDPFVFLRVLSILVRWQRHTVTPSDSSVLHRLAE